MRSWSEKSLDIRSTLDNRLILMVDALLEYMDVSLVSGHRDEREQSLLYHGTPQRSQLKWPDSKHNTFPSLAIDMQPYPYPDNENDLRAALGYMAGLCYIIAERNAFSIRWGGDWNRNGSVTDNGFDDLFHIEIYE